MFFNASATVIFLKLSSFSSLSGREHISVLNLHTYFKLPHSELPQSYHNHYMPLHWTIRHSVSSVFFFIFGEESLGCEPKLDIWHLVLFIMATVLTYPLCHNFPYLNALYHETWWTNAAYNKCWITSYCLGNGCFPLRVMKKSFIKINISSWDFKQLLH